jgi:hypothetical protein
MGKQVMYERETGVGLHRYDVSLPRGSTWR